MKRKHFYCLFIIAGLATTGFTVRKKSISITVENKMNVATVEKELKPIKVGTQSWSAENLDVSRFRNGDIIPEVQNGLEWQKAAKEGKPAWCVYLNKTENGEKYGKLYNWYAVNDSRGLAPDGWHIATDAEWAKLINYLGGFEDALQKLQSTSGWDSFEQGTNESGFNALPAGCRLDTNTFYYLLRFAAWWTATEDEKNNVPVYNIRGGEIQRSLVTKKGIGYPVRCIKN